MSPQDLSAAPQIGTSGWGLAWRLARREIKGSVRRFRVFLAALLLGVAAIGTVGSVAESMRSGIASNAQILLGGDIELRSRQTALSDDLGAISSAVGNVSQTIQMRAMLQAPNDRKLVELKAVDASWPLVGVPEVALVNAGQVAGGETGDLDSGDLDPGNLAAALANDGIVVDPQLLRSLGLSVGDKVKIGEAELRIGGGLVYEPDRSVSFISFGPRVIISTATLAKTELLQPGSFTTFRTRILLNDPADRVATVATLKNATKGTDIRVRDLNDAAPGFDEFINRAEVFLVLVGLTALLIGGLGVAGAVRAWLASRMPVIATLKCLGAPAKLIFRTYLLQVMLIASIGVVAGVLVAAITPVFAVKFLSTYVTVPIAVSIYPVPLLIAAGFGLTTSFLFALWPLAKAEEVRAATLFRSLVEIPSGRPKTRYIIISILALVTLSLLALIATRDLTLTASFIGGSIVAMLLLAGLGEGLMRLLRYAPAPRYVPARLALSAIIRPGSPVRSVVIAFGLGLSVLVAVALSQANLSRQIDTRVDQDAPAWFFIDIQPNQIDEFTQITNTTDGVTRITKTPMLRGRVTSLAGKTADEYPRDNAASWVLRGDRALSWAAIKPENANVVRGEWWPDDYAGEPLVSMSQEEAGELGVDIGDEVSFNVLGRPITATISNIRDVDWQTFAINFVFVLSPNVLEAAPHTWMATTHVTGDVAADEIQKRVTDAFSNVSSVSVREAVDTAQRVIGLLGAAVQLTALVTLVAGIAVLAGTVASTEAQRLADSIILKVLGATRVSISIAWFLEYALLGVLTGIAAAIIGSLASWALVNGFLGADFEMDFWLVLATTLAGALATALLGLTGAVRTLGFKPAPLLRQI